jgi:endonuclease-3
MTRRVRREPRAGSRRRGRAGRANRQLGHPADRIAPLIARLRERYPDARCALRHTSALELLVATILSAQCTDARVNVVTRDLFQKYRTARDYAAADPRRFEQEIRSTGFFRNKTKSVLGMAAALVERDGVVVADTMETLV